jgi:hypothetical protein
VRRLIRGALQIGVVIVLTAVGAAAGAYVAVWIAGLFDRTESGWVWMFLFALPVGLAVGGLIGLAASLWLAGRGGRAARP